MNNLLEKEFEGVYGKYKITMQDIQEVKRYRFSVLLSGISFFLGLIQWLVWGPDWVWVWLLMMALGIGLSTKLIHIYLNPIKKLLQILWLLGCVGILLLIFNYGLLK